MSYRLETEEGRVIAVCSDLHDALKLGRRMCRAARGPDVLRVMRDDGIVMGIALRCGQSGRKPMLHAARHNMANGSTVYRAPKRKRPVCPDTGEPHRWRKTGAEHNCEDCGQLGNMTRRAHDWRMLPLDCKTCGKPATSLVYTGTTRREPMCAECKQWRATG